VVSSQAAGRPPDLPSFSGGGRAFRDDRLRAGSGAGALLAGRSARRSIAKLHQYTGLPEAYIDKADLRINGGEFEKTLQDDTDTTTGRLDTRFSGPTLDPLEQDRRIRSAIGRPSARPMSRPSTTMCARI
jgi:hypothetical protein